MSHNQSRIGSKIESSSHQQSRRYVRSGSSSSYYRAISGGKDGGSGVGGGAGSSTPHPPAVSSSPSLAAAASVSNSRSFKKSGNGPGGVQNNLGYQSRSSESRIAATTSGLVYRAVRTGAHAQTPPSGNGKSGEVPEPSNATSPLPKVPSSQPMIATSNSVALSPKVESRPSAFQFGAISPGIMNGIQVPARTISAPPKLDEQKGNQALHGPVRPRPSVPMPTAPKKQEQQLNKVVGVANPFTIRESHSSPQGKRDLHVPILSRPPLPPTNSKILPMAGMAMPMPIPIPMPMPMPMPVPLPFQHQQLQIPVQFGAPNVLIHPQVVAANSLQMTMGLSAGSARQLPQPMLIPAHLSQQWPMVQQGQGLGFVPPLGHQLNPPVANLGIGIRSQFPPQKPNKFIVYTPRKAQVKITHPETREELRLEKKTDLKDSIPSAQKFISPANSQSQAVSSNVPSPQINCNSYTQPNFNQLPVTEVSITSQASKHNSVNQAEQPLSFSSPTPPNKPGPTLHGVSEGVHMERAPVSIPLSGCAQATVKIHLPIQVETVDKPPAITEEELLKVKPSEGVTASHQSQSFVSSDKPGQMPKMDSDLIEDTAIYIHSTVHPVTLSQNAIARVSSTANTSSESNGIILVGHECKKKEVVKDIESSKDNLEKSIKGNKCFDQQLQSDVINFTESIKLFSPKIIGDTDANTWDAVGHNLAIKNDDDLSLLARNSTGHNLSIKNDDDLSLLARNSTTPTDVSSLSNVTLGVGSPKGVKSIGTLAQLCSREMLGSRETQDAIHVSPDAFGLATSDFSGVERSPCILSTSTLQPVETTASKELASNLGENDVCMVDMLTEEKGSHASANILCQDSVDDGHSFHHKESSEKESPAPVLLKKDAGDIEYSDETKLFEQRVECEDCVPSKKVSTQVEDGVAKGHDSVGFTTQNLIDAETDNVYSDCDHALAVGSSCASLELIHANQIELSKSDVPTSESIVSHMTHTQEVNVAEFPIVGAFSTVSSGSKGKLSLKTPKKNTPSVRKKKKIKKTLSKADATGTSDLCNAYKGRQEKVEAFSSDISDNFPSANENHVSYDLTKYTSVSGDVQERTELDDWEDAADASTPNLDKVESGKTVNGMKQHYEESFEATSQKKYSRDFLLTLSHQFTELPYGFQIGPDVADALMILPVKNSYITYRESYLSSGRNMARSPGASRADRHAIGNMDDGKWTRPLGPDSHGVGLQPVQGAVHGFSKNTRGSGILSGPSCPSSDMERWQRGNRKGLVPSPRTPMQIMHKADNKYEVGKVTDEEEAKQRQLKAILNKLTPQNFEKLFAKVAELHIDNAVTLAGVISQIFDKALLEPTFCEMYANFCYRLAGVLPDFFENNEKITFRRLLLNKCQEEFERGEREQEEANKTEEEGGIKQSEVEREEKRVLARRRMLGNIRLIGELYKKKMLTERIMHDECIRKLLGQDDDPDEEDLEALCKLMSTIGQMIDHQRAKMHMDAYFAAIAKLSTNEKLSPRVRFMLRDVIDLRKNKWQERRKVEGPKKIDEVHRDAAQEKQAQSIRPTRGGSMQRRGPAAEFGIRGSSQLTSPSSHPVGGFRGSASQDVRSGDRLQSERRALSLPVRQNSTNENAITLGPQGGLGRGVSLKGKPLISNISPAFKNDRKVLSNQNGYNTRHSWETLRYSDMALDQSSQQHIIYPQDAQSTVFSRSLAVPATNSICSQTVTFEAEDIQPLQKKSLAALREFYSVKDEKEIALCIEELNAPNFYPLMISFWIVDSFERKDNERVLLANLIVTLSKRQDSLFTQAQLIQGFENALSSLEDAVNGAPRAAEFLGHIFAIIILENIVPFKDIGQLIHEGGEEPGSLLETGLAAEVLGNILECIKLEKGDSVLDQIQAGSNLPLVDFLPPHRINSKLDNFI